MSFANCELPYHVGGVLEHESDLLLASPQLFREHFAIDCRTGCYPIAFTPGEQIVELPDVASGEVSTESYASSCSRRGYVDQDAAGRIDLPGIFPVRTVPDAREIREWIERGTSFLAGMEKNSGSRLASARMPIVVG